MTTTTRRIQHRRGTSAQWAAANPTLASGEIGVDTTLKRWKLGDGVTAWDDLEFEAQSAADVAVETAARIAADALIQAAIDDEAAARGAADAAALEDVTTALAAVDLRLDRVEGQPGFPHVERVIEISADCYGDGRPIDLPDGTIVFTVNSSDTNHGHVILLRPNGDIVDIDLEAEGAYIAGAAYVGSTGRVAVPGSGDGSPGTDVVLEIDPVAGVLTNRWELDVAQSKFPYGIVWHPETDRLYVTGNDAVSIVNPHTGDATYIDLPGGPLGIPTWPILLPDGKVAWGNAALQWVTLDPLDGDAIVVYPQAAIPDADTASAAYDAVYDPVVDELLCVHAPFVWAMSPAAPFEAHVGLADGPAAVAFSLARSASGLLYVPFDGGGRLDVHVVNGGAMRIVRTLVDVAPGTPDGNATCVAGRTTRRVYVQHCYATPCRVAVIA